MRIKQTILARNNLTSDRPYWCGTLQYVVLWGACAASGCLANEPVMTWSSSNLLTIQREWDALADAPTTKSKHEEKQKQLNHVLRSGLSHNDVRQLAASCQTLEVRAKDRTHFENATLAYIQRTLIDSGDRENLVKLLSTRCRLRIRGYEDIEFYLAFRGHTLKDPILILGDAFAKCEVPEVRRTLAGAVRRAFLGQNITGNNDAEYVQNAMQWFRSNKSRLTVNGMYSQNTVNCPGEAFEEYPDLYERFARDLAEPPPASKEQFAQWWERNRGKWMPLFETAEEKK